MAGFRTCLTVLLTKVPSKACTVYVKFGPDVQTSAASVRFDHLRAYIGTCTLGTTIPYAGHTLLFK